MPICPKGGRSTSAPGIALAENVGGGNAGLLDVALALEVLGARLAPVPLVEHTVAARLRTITEAMPTRGTSRASS